MRLRVLSPALAALALSGCALAQAPKAEADHSAHHPPGAAPATTASGTAARTAPSPEAFDRQMKAMQDMHQRMQAARTPAERAALMDEHMKLMQSGMAMMGQMRSAGAGGMGGMGGMMMGGMGGGPGMAPPAGQAAPGTPPAGAQGMGGMMGGMMNMHAHMERRMAMMEMMMQMMVDRAAATPAPAR